uniref:Endonuclease/exonuclease/phosphatase domain-containing protein n=1 Tax=Acrobeloides nanus TaxID=290746 RepID=A0A914E3G5_9BILA
MTFNIWYGGSKVDNGIQKIAKHIKFIDPDVVAIQEIRTNKVLSEILQQLGSKWTGIQGSDKDYPNNGILTRHKIIASKFSEIGTGVGAAILFNNNKTINFWGLHLFYKSFGLYAAHNKLITSSEQIMAGETHGMFYNGKNYCKHPLKS